MKTIIFSLCVLFLLSACATTGMNRANDSQIVTSDYQGPPPGSTLKCNCAATFTVSDVYFP